MVRRAPLALLIVFVVGLGAAYWGVSSHYAERFATFEERDKYLSGRIADYEKAFPGKSPDEAAKEVASLRDSLEIATKHLDVLEKAVSLAQETNQKEISDIQHKIELVNKRPFSPWVLTADEKVKLRKILREEADRKFVINYMCLVGSSQSQTFVQDLYSAFREEDWTLQGNCFLNNIRPDLVGIYLGLSFDANDGENIPDDAPRLLSMLTRAGLTVHVAFGDMQHGSFALVIGNPED